METGDLKKMIKSQNKHDLILQTMGAIADQEGIEIYAVGGYLRDRQLQKETSEIDFVIIGNGPEFAKKAMKKQGGSGWISYPKYGTASFLWKNFKFEFVTARSEKYQPNSRKPTIQTTNLNHDLMRRDFTINTMAMALNKNNFGQLVDPFGGQNDILKKIIKTPLDPKVTFHEDPLRIMRAARFAAQLDFHIDPKTQKAMENERVRLNIVSQERITDEFLKILSQETPSIGFRILKNTKILEVIFPELAALVGVEQRDAYHHKDVFEHTIKVVDNIAKNSDNLPLRFTALVHDIAKPIVKRFIQGTGWTFYGHEAIGVAMLKQICSKLKLPGAYCRFSQKLTQLHMRPIQLIGKEVTDSAIRRLLFEAGDDIEALMMLCRADITSGNPKRVKKYLSNFDYVIQRMKKVEENDRLRSFQSPVTGHEIMKLCKIKPGPLVGKLKNKIEEAILDGDIPNEHDAAYQYLLKIKDQLIH